MKFTVKGLGLFIAISFLIVMNVGILFYLIANIYDWKVSFLNINPAYKTYSLPMNILYPPSPDIVSAVIGPNTIYVELVLNYAMMVKRQPITLGGMGTISDVLEPNVKSVTVAFEGALPYDNNAYQPSGTNYWGLQFTPTMADVNNMSLYAGASLVCGTSIIEFPKQGNYYPTLVVEYNNVSTFSYPYNGSAYLIQIDSDYDLQQQNSSRITTASSISVVLFGIVDGCAYIANLVLKRKEKNGEKPTDTNQRLRETDDNNKTNQPNTQNPKTKKVQPYYKIQRQKRRSRKKGKKKN